MRPIIWWSGEERCISALLCKEDFLEAKKVIQQKNKDSGRNYRGKKLVGQLDTGKPSDAGLEKRV